MTTEAYPTMLVRELENQCFENPLIATTALF